MAELFSTDKRQKWRDTRALAVRQPTCPVCHVPLLVFNAGVQHALFLGAGYGEGTRRTFRVCPCGYARLARTEAVSPRG